MALSEEKIRNLPYKETIDLINKHKLGRCSYPDTNGGLYITSEHLDLDSTLASYENWKDFNKYTYNDSIKERSKKYTPLKT